MLHHITPATVRLILSTPFDYLSAGVEYLATPSVQRSGKRKGVIQSYRIDRADDSGGTFLRPYQWAQMLASGIASISPALCN